MALIPIKTRTIPDSADSIEPVAFTASGKGIYKDNPFITCGAFAVETKHKTEVIGQDLSILDKKSDEIACGAIVRRKVVDVESFIKIYSKNIAVFFELNATAQKALIAVILAVQDQAKDKAEIYLSYQQAVEYYQSINYEKIPSKNLFSRGLSLLIEAKFIANHWRKAGWYWTNPNILFNGNRIAFIDLYVSQRREERMKELEEFNKLNS